MLRKIFPASLLLFLLGCASTYNMTNIFDKEEVSWINQDGSSTITGQAFLNQQGGGVVTCAGKEVSLIPVTNYSSERMEAIYGSTEQGYKSHSWLTTDVSFTPSTPAEFFTSQKKATCDAQGNFKFKEVPSGKEYFVLTKVRWIIDSSEQGGDLMLKTTSKENEITEIILTQQ